MWSPTLDTPPQEIIDTLYSDNEFDRAGRIRIYQFIELVEEILKNGLGK